MSAASQGVKRASRPKRAKAQPAKKAAGDGVKYHMRLYVAGRSQKSLAAQVNLRRICEEHLQGRYEVEVIDLLAQPELASKDQIIALPTLVRRLPEPLRRIIGDLSNSERVLAT